MKQKSVILGLAALLIVGLVATSAMAFPFGGNSRGVFENREDVEAAIEAGDFDAWKEAWTEELTEDNFNQAVERHKNMMQQRENMDAIREAIEENDYETWKSLVSEMDPSPKIAEYILDEDDFNILCEIHLARSEGDFDTADELAEELGIESLGLGPNAGFQGNLENGGRMGRMMHKLAPPTVDEE